MIGNLLGKREKLITFTIKKYYWKVLFGPGSSLELLPLFGTFFFLFCWEPFFVCVWVLLLLPLISNSHDHHSHYSATIIHCFTLPVQFKMMSTCSGKGHMHSTLSPVSDVSTVLPSGYVTCKVDMVSLTYMCNSLVHDVHM